MQDCELCLYKNNHGNIRCFACKHNPEYQYNITPILIAVDEYHQGLLTPKEVIDILDKHIKKLKEV